MALETANYINDLVITNPTSTDPKSQGDDHLRLIKTVLKETLNGFTGAVLVTATDTGTASAHVLTPTTALVGYTAMLCLLYLPAVTNVGAVTVNVSGLGAKSIKTITGTDPTAGDIVAGQPLLLMYNGTNFIQIAGSGYVENTAANQTINGNLTITGNHTVNSNETVNGALTVNGAAAFNGIPTGPMPGTGASTLQLTPKGYVDGLAYASVTLPILQGQTLTTEAQTMLSAASYRSEYITASANSFFILPDARTLQVGFCYEINSVNAVQLMANDGTYIGSASVPAGLSRLWLLSNATQAGSWAVSPAVSLTTLSAANMIGNVTTITSSLTQVNGQVKLIALDSARTLVLYHTAAAASANSGLYAVVATCSYTAFGRPTATIGTPVLISGGANTGVGGGVTANSVACAISASLINTDLTAVSWHEYNGTTTTPRCAVVQTSGTSATAGTVQTLHTGYTGGLSGTGATAGTSIAALGAGNFVVAYYDPSGTVTVYARACTTSGTAITLGGEYTVQAIAGTAGAISASLFAVAHSSTLVSFATYYNPGTTNKTYITAATVSGIILSMGTPVQFATVTASTTDIVAINATTGVFLTSNSYVAAYTISGNTVTMGAGTGSMNGMSIAPLSSSSFLVFGTSTTGYNCSVSGTTVTQNSTFSHTTPTNSFGPAGNAIVNGTAVVFQGDIFDKTTQARRGLAISTNQNYTVTASSHYEMLASVSGGTTVTLTPYMPFGSLS